MRETTEENGDDNTLARWKAMRERQEKRMELRLAWLLVGDGDESSLRWPACQDS